jgi:restriction endonuclease S subunit
MQLFRSERGRREILSRASRANITNISQDSLEGIEIPLPPIEEQRGIATEIEFYQRVVDGCLAVLDRHKLHLDINSAWPRKPLGEIARFISGGTPSKANAAYWEGSIPWVSPKDMKLDRLTDSIDHISEQAVIDSAVNLVHPGTVLCVIRSGVLVHTFPVALAGVDLTFNQDINAIVPDQKSLLPEWLFFILRTLESEILQRGIKRGGTVHSLQNGYLRSLPFPVPPLPAQKEIITKLQREQATLAGLEELKAKYAAKIAARLATVWGEPETAAPA